jgi:hypothetical protein
MRGKWTTWLAWLVFGLISLGALILLIYTITQRSPQESTIQLAGNGAWILFPVGFGFIAAIILTYQPRNIIGWLLMIPAVAFTLQNPLDSYLAGFSAAPLHPSILLLLIIWYGSWSWMLIVFPLVLIILLFPTGRLPSPRWRWVLTALIGIFLITLGLLSFSPNMETTDGKVSFSNPVGFIPAQVVDPLTSIFVIIFILLIIICVASVFVRYWHAAAVEREQIKWLMYAGGLFAVLYIPDLGMNLTSEVWNITDIGNLLFPVMILAIPTGIGIAILRYRLWDIDVIIRRTLVYGALTGTLALVYFGLITVLQGILSTISSQQSTISIVLSTLTIAALFNPLRTRLQNFIDRRFYRSKYNAEQALATFSRTARDEVEMERLTSELLGVIQETMQPATTGLWIQQSVRTKNTASESPE